MKKGTILIVGLITLLMAGGLVFAGCSSGGGDDDNSGGGGGGCSWENGNVCISEYLTTISCDKESCAVNKGHGEGNTTLKCNC
jgi:hypothetical protein